VLVSFFDYLFGFLLIVFDCDEAVTFDTFALLADAFEAVTLCKKWVGAGASSTQLSSHA